MITFKPLSPLRSGYVRAALIVGWLLLLFAISLWVKRPFSFITYLGGLVLLGLVVLWGVVTYRALALKRLAYTIDRNALRVRWGWSTLVVPMPDITHVYRPGKVQSPRAFAWWRWPAPHVWTYAEEGRTWYFLATRAPDDLWFFCGDDFCVGLSPEDGEALVREVNRRRALGPSQRLRFGWVPPRPARWRIWQDVYALLGWLGGVVFLVLIWGEAARRADLPTPRRLAELATLVFAADWLLGMIAYRRERLAALLLWWGGSIVLAVLLIGLWTSRI